MPPGTDPRSDQQLISAMNSGDADAFEPLYRRYREFVLRLAWRFTRNEQDALDVMQETFAYLAQKFPGFRLNAAMTSFLYPVVKNLSIAARNRTRRFTPGDAVTDIAQSSPKTTDTEDIAAALAGLDEPHREVLLARFVDGLSLQEIADAFAIPLGTVKSRLHHAIAALRANDRARKFFAP